MVFQELKRQMGKEILFSDMEEDDLQAVEDSDANEAYDLIENEFRVLPYTVAVRDDALYEALAQLDDRDRDVLLLAYWLNMSDMDISDETGTPRRTVNNIKRRAYEKMRKILEGNGYGANTFFPKSGA